MKIREYRMGRSFDIQLEYGEGIRQAVEQVCRAEGVAGGLVSAGLGGFGRFEMSFAGREARDRRSWADLVLQLSAVQGFILEGETLVSATVTIDGKEPLTWCGRVEDGCERLFYGELMLTELLPAGEDP